MAIKNVIEPVSRTEVAEATKEYYQLMTEISEDWQSTVFAAIDAWEREPILLQKIIDAEDMLEEAEAIIDGALSEYSPSLLKNADWLAKYRGEDGD
jgi:hypothetical protein